MSRRSGLNALSSALYRAARLTRDANAVSRGPGAVGKRVLRKATGRAYGRAINRWIR